MTTPISSIVLTHQHVRPSYYISYFIMLLVGLGIFISSIFAAFDYVVETSKVSTVNQAYDYFVLLQAHHQMDNLVHRLQIASIDANSVAANSDNQLELYEQLGVTWARINDLSSGENAARLRLVPGLPEFVNKVQDTFKHLEHSLEEELQPNYANWFAITRQLSFEFIRFAGSPTGLLAIQQQLKHSKTLMYLYFIGILISGTCVLLMYGFALYHTLKISNTLARVNLQLQSESEQLRRVKETLSYQATHDSLTNLTNRREFERCLQDLLENVHQEGGQHAICYMDLDQFKVINDTCGHIAGDELLRQLASKLKNQVRKEDMLARLGGDEFAALLVNCTITEVEQIAEGLRQTVQNFSFMWRRDIFEVGISIGVVQINKTSGSVATVLSNADAACYIAKEQGRNRVHFYESDDHTAQRHKGEMAWVSRISQAYAANRFRLYRQLIVPVQKTDLGKTHYEILIRMLDEKGQIIPPMAFLPAAERYNLMANLDRWIVQTLFTWLTAHPQALTELTTCSINLSGVSIREKNFSNFLLEQIQQYAMPAEKICFEVTETVAIANLAEASQFMNVLKDQGCRFALDDFGSGMSSFAYLKNLPVDFLKIDGSFVKNMLTDHTDCVMVEAIHRVGHVMGLQTIAEYVENEAILYKLQEIGVDYAQGYGIAKPEPLVPV